MNERRQLIFFIHPDPVYPMMNQGQECDQAQNQHHIFIRNKCVIQEITPVLLDLTEQAQRNPCLVIPFQPERRARRHPDQGKAKHADHESRARQLQRIFSLEICVEQHQKIQQNTGR